MPSLQKVMVTISGEVDHHLKTVNRDVSLLLQHMEWANSLLHLETSLLGITNGDLEIPLSQTPLVERPQ